METDSSAAASAGAPRDARQPRNMSIYNEDHAPSPSTGALCKKTKNQKQTQKAVPRAYDATFSNVITSLEGLM